MNYMTIYRTSLADGEGWRTVLFVAGCHHHCKECHNKESWNPTAGQPFTKEVNPEKIIYLGNNFYRGRSASYS